MVDRIKDAYTDAPKPARKPFRYWRSDMVKYNENLSDDERYALEKRKAQLMRELGIR